ncbi:MAG: hypothetical protein AAF443_08140 [Chlamydiota bacterium]
MRWLFILRDKWEQWKEHLTSSHLSIDKLIQAPWAIGAVFLALLSPFIGAFMHLCNEQNQLSALSEQVHCMPLKMERALEKQRERQIFVKKYGEAQEDYLEHVFKEKVFLSSEVEILRELEQMPACASCLEIGKRLSYLRNKNKLIFRRVSQQSIGEIREQLWKQCRPIEVDQNDLKSLLVKIEGEMPNKPQLAISAFHLKRNSIAGRESYTLEMEIIERTLNPT